MKKQRKIKGEIVMGKNILIISSSMSGTRHTKNYAINLKKGQWNL